MNQDKKQQWLIVIGFLLITAGFLMPSTIENQTTRCTDEVVVDGVAYCENSVTITEEENNDFKIPVVIGGGVLVLIAWVFDEELSSDSND